MLDSARTLKNIYEINTAVYLNRLSRKLGKRITLAHIPESELTRIASYGCDAIWLMGVWQRSPFGANLALHDTPLMNEVHKILPDFTRKDMLGSAYAVRDYRVDDAFGGEAGLEALRARLATHGLKLILDFVPNHTAFDHKWTSSHPNYYIHGRLRDTLRHRTWYRRRAAHIIACGKDPQFDPWPDVAQLNAFSGAYRHVSIESLLHIASLCDGVRCDMAMLLLNDVFVKTWGKRAGTQPKREYWDEVISTVHTAFPHFIFIAESYWDTQRALIAQGFDYCYDKDIYDHIVAGNPTAAADRVAATKDIAAHLLHFLENHDEPRIATLLSETMHRTAIRYMLRLPGPRLWHDGQFEGFRMKLPVHIGRGPDEPIDATIATLYRDELHR